MKSLKIKKHDPLIFKVSITYGYGQFETMQHLPEKKNEVHCVEHQTDSACARVKQINQESSISSIKGSNKAEHLLHRLPPMKSLKQF